jgi:hypothetical protein
VADLFGTGFGGADYSQVTPSDVYQTAGSDVKEGTEKTPVDQALAVAQETQTDRSDPRYRPDFSIMEDYFADFATGDKSVQGASPVQTQAKPKGEPEFDISDILEQSQKMTQANMLMQLGAGIFGGDVSKGIAAAGAAGMKGAQEQRALDIRKRLAEYQAGREDIRRGEEADRFERQMKLQERKVDISASQFQKTLGQASDKLDADIAKAGRVSKGQLLTFVADIVQESLRNYVPKEGESMEEVAAALSDQLLRKYAGFMDVDVSGLPTTTGGTQTGSRSREDILAQYNVAN